MTRIDHTNCPHPRTPAGRAACRKAGTVASVEPSASLTREQLMDGMTTREKDRFTAKLQSDADKARGRLAKRSDSKAVDAMARADAKVRVVVVTRVEDIPMPKLTPAQLQSPIFQSLLRNRKV